MRKSRIKSWLALSIAFTFGLLSVAIPRIECRCEGGQGHQMDATPQASSCAIHSPKPAIHSCCEKVGPQTIAHSFLSSKHQCSRAIVPLLSSQAISSSSLSVKVVTNNLVIPIAFDFQLANTPFFFSDIQPISESPPSDSNSSRAPPAC